MASYHPPFIKTALVFTILPQLVIAKARKKPEHHQPWYQYPMPVIMSTSSIKINAWLLAQDGTAFEWKF